MNEKYVADLWAKRDQRQGGLQSVIKLENSEKSLKALLFYNITLGAFNSVIH